MEKSTRVLIWGGGNECKKRIDFLPNEWEIVAIIDSDLNKQGRYWENTNVKIIAPVEIDNYQYDFIVIMSILYGKQIFSIAMDMKISVTKIINGCRHTFNSTIEDHQKFFRELVIKKRRQLDSEYKFENRKKNCNSLFYVLTGYKRKLWKDVFDRMRAFLPMDIDVCLLSSGLYSKELSRIADENHWSYLSTEVNDVSIIQNLVIDLFPEATLIYKMDEDIYITEHCCEKLRELYFKLIGQNDFKIGMIGPMIPLHTNGFLFLQTFRLDKKYESKFGKLIQGGRWTNSNYASDIEIPKFLWSQGNIDDLNRKITDLKPEYYITPVKYAICFVLFSRKLYEEMEGFSVNRETMSFGIAGDEGQINDFCMQHCYLNVVALNTLCGHFSYPMQENEMIQFKENNYKYFEIKMS